jgi:exodeoxyribonuclease V alpha subunit
MALNQRLQKRLIGETEGQPKARIGNLELHLGDRICQRVNNYSIHHAGVFNGDQGTVIGIDAEENTVQVRLWDGREVEYKGEALYQLDLAYALSIHRSQGSEVPVVVLVLHDSHTIMLEKQLVYTAITRAKALLIVVGTKRALILAVKRNRSQRRFTALIEEIQRLL